MGSRGWVMAALALAVAGCDEPKKGVRVSGTTTQSIAVGASYRFGVVDLCDNPGPGFIVLGHGAPLIIPTPPSCLTTSVDAIVSYTFSDPSILDLAQSNVSEGAALFEVHAARAGTTTFTATISTSFGTEYTASGEFTAEDVVTVDLEGECSNVPDASDELVPTNRTANFTPRLFGASGERLIGFGYTPFSVDNVPITLDEHDTYVMPARGSLGQAIVTSSADPTFRKTIQFFDATSVTSLELRSSAPVLETAADDGGIGALAKIGEEHSCFDYLPRRYVTETPASCGLHNGSPTPVPPPLVTEMTSNGRYGVGVRGLVRGTTCRVRAEIIGGTATTTIDLPVHEGWTKQAPPSGIGYLAGISTGPDHVILVGTRNAGTGSAPLLTAALAEWDGTSWTQSTPSIPANATNTGRLDGIAAAGTTLFSVGSGGAIITRTGTGAWTEMTSGTTANLVAVHALSTTDAFAVGDAGTVVRLTGSTWQPVAAGFPATARLNSVWGAGPDDVYVAGFDANLRHWNGTSWTAIDLAPIVAPQIAVPMQFRAIWGSGSDDVYVGGSAGTMGALVHWDGSAWTVARRENVEGIWGSGPDDIHVTGKGGFGEVSHWDGMTWSDRNVALYFTIDVWGWGSEETYVMAYTNEFWRYR